MASPCCSSSRWPGSPSSWQIAPTCCATAKWSSAETVKSCWREPTSPRRTWASPTSHEGAEMQHVVDAASLGSLDAMLALGIALVFGVMHLVNFAHGELVMVGGFTIYL